MSGDYEKHVNDVTPDSLQGYENAGERFAQVLQDAERRIKSLAYLENTYPARMGGIRLHAQTNKDYENPDEKTAVMDAAERVLIETLDCKEDKDPIGHQRFKEALSTMKMEEEEVFVVVVLGNTQNLVYWNWDYAYAIWGAGANVDDGPFRLDVDQRQVASPTLAKSRYGSMLVDPQKTARSHDQAPGA